MTRDEARQLIDSYCYDDPPDHEAAIDRLLPFDLSEFNEVIGLGHGDQARQQDLLDYLIYQDSIIYTEE